jgi:multidrug efflux pump subunit AcrB
MKKFNLTEIALRNKTLVYFFVAMIFVGGYYGYQNLGRSEDPDFPIRVMIVSLAWPGATASEVADQITDRVEKKLQETPHLDYLESVSRAGLSVIYVNLKEDRPFAEIRPTWQEVRNLVGDIKGDLPQGAVGPFFNDRFDDVFGSIFALTSDDFSYEEMRERAEEARQIFLRLENVRKVDLIGVQEEKIYVEMETARLAELGLSPLSIMEAIGAQSSVQPTGLIDTSEDNIYIRLSGRTDGLADLRALPIAASGRYFRLGDIATVRSAYGEPADPAMFWEGRKAIGLAVSMEIGGDVIKLGKDLERAVERVARDLPAGLELVKISDQPKVVEESIGEFVSSLREAILIVLAVSFFSLGWRSGLVVALCIPLVLVGTFLGMYIGGINLHKVSLGTLIMALGLLVDDEIIAVEMMSVKLEEGLSRFEAAIAAYKITAIPMLTGTLVTCAGFIPVGFSKGLAADFTRAIFPVISLAVLLSWFVSVLVAPLTGYHLMKVKANPDRPGLGDRFQIWFKKILASALRRPKTIIAATMIAFLISLGLFGFIKRDFFPPSARPEIIIEMTLQDGASLKATQSAADRFAAFLDQEKGLASYSYYVGVGAPRFIQTMEPILPVDNYAQFVILAENIEARRRLDKRLLEILGTEFPDSRSNLKLIQTGPPADYPVMLRVSGFEASKVRATAEKVAAIMRLDDNLTNVNLNWNEKAKSLRVKLDDDKIRALGLDRRTLSLYLQASLSGAVAGEFYRADRSVDIVFRLDAADRSLLGEVGGIPIYLPNGRYVSLEQVAGEISYQAEESAIRRRNLKPTITARATNLAGTANDQTREIYEATGELRKSLPPGYSIEVDGILEQSDISQDFIARPIPLMILAIVTILMFQLRRFSMITLALLTAPMGLIGVSLGMLLFGKPMGFVAQMGVLALSGMIIRNSVILLDQIDKHLAEGHAPWDALIDSASSRFRPITLTAGVAVLAMIPLTRSLFWGPMAVAIAGGLIVATLLTLLTLPCLYAVMFRVKENGI